MSVGEQTSVRDGRRNQPRHSCTLPRHLILSYMRLILLLAFVAGPAHAQQTLRAEVRAIAADAHGKVSVACSLPGTSLNCDLNPHAHPPMQSVFKLPVAIAVLHQVEQGKMTLDQPIRFRPEDRFVPHAFSPLQDKY